MWLRAFAARLPRLRAAESMRHLIEIAVGSGVVDSATSRAIRSDWEREAAGAQRHRSTRAEVLALAASVGFQVVVEEKPE